MIPIIILAIEDPNDRDFMINLYISYNRLMFSEIQKITCDTWASDDVLQISLIKLIEKVSLLRTFERNRLVSYIITTCRNNAYNYTKKLASSLECELIDTDGVDFTVSPLEQMVIQKEYQNALKLAWDNLDERSKYFLESKYILEKKDQEIAKDLNINPNSVRMNLTRSRNKFKAKIEELGSLPSSSFFTYIKITIQ